jgi:hypothetical protein
VVIVPVTRAATHLVVEPGHRHSPGGSRPAPCAPRPAYPAGPASQAREDERLLPHIAEHYLGLLGDHRGIVVARTVLHGLADDARAAREGTFTYGVMHERQTCQASEIATGCGLPAAVTRPGTRSASRLSG